jgi:arsenate reductase
VSVLIPVHKFEKGTSQPITGDWAPLNEPVGTHAMTRSDDSVLYADLACYVGQREEAFGQIPGERKENLEAIAHYVGARIGAGRPARLTFICTHNSRRSHMSQIWAQTAAAHYGVDNVATFSGGTEATEFDRRAVAALRRAGFVIDRVEGERNAVYAVRYGEGAPVMKAFSKVYDAKSNPSEDYCAVMTCSQADKNCPVVRGASLRVSIPYDDPKDFDGSDQETAKYDERCRQISGEMLYLFSLVGP